MTKQTVFIAAGGTGGHMYPAVALAHQLTEQKKKVVWIGSGSKLEQKVLAPYAWTYKVVRAKPYRGTGIKAKLLLPFHLLLGVATAWRLLRRHKPIYLITTGGYVSVASTIAACLAGVPVFLCEQNARPGLANRYLSRYVRAIFTAYPKVFSETIKQQYLQMGNPLRRQMIEHSMLERSQANQKLRLLILGGSQGAAVFNEQVPKLLSQLRDKDRIAITHIAGPSADKQAITDAYSTSGYVATVHNYVQDMASLYLESDLVLARSGALTLAELMQFSLPALLVPLPNSADNHQYYNALYHHRLGACRLIEQPQLLQPFYLANTLQAFISDSSLSQRMRKAAKSLQKPAAAESIIAHCDALI
tara:strand:+ start:400 stop:1482 length:1083 start_codon:yes stop_codon:yes gene_type:complete